MKRTIEMFAEGGPTVIAATGSRTTVAYQAPAQVSTEPVGEDYLDYGGEWFPPTRRRHEDTMPEPR